MDKEPSWKDVSAFVEGKLDEVPEGLGVEEGEFEGLIDSFSFETAAFEKKTLFMEPISIKSKRFFKRMKHHSTVGKSTEKSKPKLS
jgi:hypothetical protein